MNPAVENILSKYDVLGQPCVEVEIGEAVKNAIGKDTSLADIPEVKYEQYAFDFWEAGSSNQMNWGTYYGPMMTMPAEDGGVNIYPSIELLSDGTFTYWETRAHEATHPLIKARYADLVWDLKKVVTGNNPDIEYADIVINCITLLIESRGFKHDINIASKAKRAVYLAKRLNRPEMLQRLTIAILGYCLVAKDKHPGLWTIPFWLLLNVPRPTLSSDQKTQIIDDLEKRLTRLADSSNESFNPHILGDTAKMLATYYRKSNQPVDMHRVLDVYGKAIYAFTDKAEPITASSLLQRLHAAYSDFSMSAQASEVMKKIGGVGPGVIKGMKEFSSSVKIPEEQINKLLDLLMDGGKRAAIQKIAIYFLQKKDQVSKQVIDLSKVGVFSSMFSKQIVDSKGRPLAVVRPVSEDLDSNIIAQMAQNIQISSGLLELAISRLIEDYSPNPDDLHAELKYAPLIEGETFFGVRIAIEAYYKEDYLGCAYILMPQIEAIIRRLAEFIGISILQQNSEDGYDYRGLGNLLFDPAIVDALGEDFSLFCRVLLIDRKGLNFRNDMLHGITPVKNVGKLQCNWLLHLVFFLSMMREKGEI